MACYWKRQAHNDWRASCGAHFVLYKETPKYSGVTYCPSCGDVVHVELMDELKPCPHCGKIDTLKCSSANEIEANNLNDSDNFAVVCSVSNGGCGAVCGYQRTEAEAVNAWNVRY